MASQIPWLRSSTDNLKDVEKAEKNLNTVTWKLGCEKTREAGGDLQKGCSQGGTPILDLTGMLVITFRG